MCIDSNYYKQPLWVKILELQEKDLRNSRSDGEREALIFKKIFGIG